MAVNFQFNDSARLGRRREPDLGELLGAAGPARFGQDAPRRADFGIEMPA